MRRPIVLPLRGALLVVLSACSVGLPALGPVSIASAAPAPGTIEVKACASSSARRTDAWRPSLSTGQPVEAADFCSATSMPKPIGSLDPTGTFGFWASTPAPDPPLTAQPGRVAGYTVTAPDGTTISAAMLDRTFALRSAEWEIQVRAGDSVVLRCTGPTSAGQCANGTAASGTALSIPAGTTTIDVAAHCIAATSCNYLAGTTPTFSALLRGATLTLADGTAPTTTAPVAGDRVDEQIADASTIMVRGTDGLGIERLQLIEGGIAVATRYASCVDWSLTPCAEPSTGAQAELVHAFKVGELGLTTGPHVLRVRAVDAAGNVTLGDPATVIVREPLFAASGLQGAGRSSAATRELRWSIPAGMNAASSRVELCPTGAPATDCVLTPAAAPTGPFSFASASYPDVRVRVQLTSVGGGVTWSAPTNFVFDATPPAVPRLGVTAIAAGRRFTTRMTTAADETDLAGWAARLCRTSTNSCDPLSKGVVQRPGSVDIPVTAPADTGYRLDVTLTDTAGNESAAAQLPLTIGPSFGPTTEPNKSTAVDVLTVSPVLPKRLAGDSLLVRGTTKAGSATGAARQVTVTVAGRTKAKKAIRVTKPAKLSKTGAFAVRVRLPRGLDRRRGVLVTIVATPATGKATTTRIRLRS